MRAAVPSVPAVLCGSAGLLLLLLRWRRWRGLWRKVKEARERQERGLEQMDKAVRAFRQQHPSVNLVSILSLSLPELSKKIQDGSLPPEHVFYAYVGKALQIARETNCITEYMQESETQLQHTKPGEKKGLLYGVPVSIKDSINCQLMQNTLAVVDDRICCPFPTQANGEGWLDFVSNTPHNGHDSMLGFVKNIDKPVAEDSVLVQVLKRQGAIPFVKTNVPQSLISYDCNNLIFGQTCNPLLYTRTPGGSSGGEGALIGGGGSILGFGTDLGGSLRFPAAFCGICALKPTGNRLSKKGVISGICGQKSVTPAVGPMAKDVESLALCMRALLCEDMFNLDSTVPPLPFNEEVYSSTQPLRIGYYETDFFTMPSPAMRRAVRETKQLLEDAGHTLVPFELTNVDYSLYNFCFRGMFADGGVTFLNNFEGELEKGNLGIFFWLVKSPNWMKTLLSWITKPFVPRLSNVIRSLRANTVEELWSLHREIEESCHQFIAQWKKLNLDVMLCPMLGPALLIGYPAKLSVAVSYTMLYNSLDFPVGVVPVTLATDEDEKELKNYQGYFRDWWDRGLATAFSSAEGMPVAVQCVALPWQEELCLRFMKEVETLVTKKNMIV
ncbi:fatty-acid amide hydrolase 1-like isoform X1 [Centrocercus urophasianus]|uniref:fatty-acid amide hydrolase 1-like isoform X1 n=1 Tax=Centrocercus urophasianus TaxID=9002 RepID=UPI001C645865|nr:fatty-acid amide hydrolase 1-like isoform X1 [Centrocercus urophasianus]